LSDCYTAHSQLTVSCNSETTTN